MDSTVGLVGVRADIAMMRTPDGHGRVELSRFHTPPAIRAEPERAPSNTLGIRRIMFTVDDVDDVVARLRGHGAELVGEIAQYEDMYRLCFVRGPEGFIVGLAGSSLKPDVVTPEQWRAAREALLVKEKAHTRARDALAAERRRMPMIRVEKDYGFTAPGGGDATLLDLFDGSRQLVVYRFFMDPDMDVYPERGCPGCSMYADQLSNLLHLRERDTRFAAVSRGEQEHLQRYREHASGWEFPWYTLRDGFDADHDVAEWHGTNVFLRDGDEVYRTYLIDARGDEALGSTWSFLDITPYGRQEAWEDSPAGWPQTPPYTWGGWHDKYDHTL